MSYQTFTAVDRPRSAHTFVTGNKVAGLYDHSAGRHLRIAVEARAQHLQGYDGERDTQFGGTLPEIQDTAEGTFLHMEIWDGTAQGYDRGSSGHFTTKVAERLAQVYDHAEEAWFAFNVQVA